jgi:putative RNA 2'-phosphotransferase
MASPRRLAQLSKFLSLILRHRPAAARVSLDDEGWASVDELIAQTKGTRNAFTRLLLEEIVASDAKTRYSFSPDGTMIRANQGHSIPVDLGLVPTDPPDALYHGTANKFLDSIMREGLKPMSRLQVHLSAAPETAVAVGRRHGAPVVLVVDAATMKAEGHTFFVSKNGVWLIDRVPPQYLRVAAE